MEIAGCEPVVCEWCLEDFIRKSWGRGSQAIYCSDKCGALASKARSHGGLSPAPGYEWDALLPEQLGLSPGRSGEYGLLQAFLERNVMDANPEGRGKKSRERSGSDYEEAIAWFQDTSDEPWTFRWVAQHLGINPEWFLAKLESESVRYKIRRGHSRNYQIHPRCRGDNGHSTQDVVAVAC